MPDPSSTSVFGRRPSRPSLFSGKKRKESKDIKETSSIAPWNDEASPPPTRRDSTAASLPSSVNEGKLHRSGSIASHHSQSSLTRHKSRAPSVANASSRSPTRLHRVSRSISANAAATAGRFGSFSSTAAISPQKSHESILQQQQHSPSSRPRDPTAQTTFEAPPKTPFSMLVTPFGHGVKRQDTSATFASKSGSAGEAGSTVAPGLTTGGAYTPAVTHQHILEIANKRISTLEYLRKLHEGQIYYFNTLHYTATNISQMGSMMPSRLGRRATNYLLLGTSIPPLLDLNQGNPLEYLRVLHAVLTEFDTFQNLSTESGATARNRMGQIMKRVRTGRRSSAATDILMMDTDNNASSTALDAMPLPPSVSYGNHQEFVHLQTPSLPFDPDFSTSFATLTDILIDTYDGVMQLLPGPEACSPAVNEAFLKADKLLRKILVQNIAQEFGDHTRKEVKSEVAGLGKVVLSGLM